jgi:hypothetical protein
MTKKEKQIWSEVFPLGVEIYYDGNHPTRFTREMIQRYGVSVKNGGAVCRVTLPVELFQEVCGGHWRGQLGAYDIWK